MPQDRDFKRIVRRRMAQTGETYTAARAALAPEPAAPGADVGRWLRELERPELARAAYQALAALPEARLREAALSGLDMPAWRVRRGCCKLLDDLSLTRASIAALERRLDDAHPLVRRAALHALGCRPCKPDGRAPDVRPLLERMASDSNRHVRGAVLMSLTLAYDDEPWAIDLIRRCAEGDPSPRLREGARIFLGQLEAKRRSNELRLQLPPDLRAKTERHRGKTVAIAGGRIVGVDDAGAFRHARRTWPDVAFYWVAPEARGTDVPFPELVDL